MPPVMNKYHVVPNIRPYEPPFVLMNGDVIVDLVFEFLKKIHGWGLATKTIRAYAFDFLCFYRFLSKEHLTPDIFTHQHLADFIISQREKGTAPRTINRRLLSVRNFLNSLAEGHGEKLFVATLPSFYKGTRNKALLGPTRLKSPPSTVGDFSGPSGTMRRKKKHFTSKCRPFSSLH